MLEIEDLEVRYGQLRAVNGISLRVAKGECIGLIGPNGAGKTTTLSAVAGILSPSTGAIRLAGESLAGRSPEAIVRAGVALVPEGRRIFTRLTVDQNLMLGATIRDDEEVTSDLEQMRERFPVLGRYAETQAGKLSGGEQQQLAIARALMCRPQILLLDEPSLGLAPKMVDEVFALVEQLRAEGLTIVLVEQNGLRTLELAQRTYVLQGGSMALIADGPDDLEAVERAYFGAAPASREGAVG